MKIGFIGLGKLGLPVATCMAMAHDVVGFDKNPERMQREGIPEVEAGPYPGGEVSFEDCLKIATRLKFADSLGQAVKGQDVVFIAVETPHDPEYEGITPMPYVRKDFDYAALRVAVRRVMSCADAGTVIAIISTVLPRTIRRELAPLARRVNPIIYNPSFIAMGTVMRDFLYPEFILLGHDEDPAAALRVLSVHRDLSGDEVQVHQMSWESAELTKVAYNTFISMKLGFANVIGELSDRIGADADHVMTALKGATDRIISSTYLTPGMGDGGGCHPRDNIAMSWLARKTNLSNDPFREVIAQREAHANWLAQVVFARALGCRLPIILYGYAYKPGTTITTGSAALLTYYYLTKLMNSAENRVPALNKFDPLIGNEISDLDPVWLEKPACFLIGCAHKECFEFRPPQGSVVVDPWGRFPDIEGVYVLHPGRRL